VQLDFANRIAVLIACFQKDDENVYSFLRVFNIELAIQWKKLDKHRMSKYMSLVRYMTRESFKWILKENSDVRVQKYTDNMMSTVLSSQEYGLAGLQLHHIDIFFAELKSVAQSLKLSYLIILLTPFLSLFAKSLNKSVQRRVAAKLLSPLLNDVEITLDEDDWGKIRSVFHAFVTSETSACNIEGCYAWIAKIDHKFGKNDVLKTVEDELDVLEKERAERVPEEIVEEDTPETEDQQNTGKKRKREPKKGKDKQRRKRRKRHHKEKTTAKMTEKK